MTVASYPAREPFYAHRLTRLLFKSCACQEMGHHAVCLVCHIAHTEDAARYQGPVRFWNSQLMETLGFRSPKQLTKARHVAVDAGWLHYERDGGRKVGRYWTLIPPHVTKFDDLPIEEPASMCSPGGTEHPPIHSENGMHTDAIHSENGTYSGMNSGMNCGKLSYPSPDPSPNRERAHGCSTTDDRVPDGGLLDLIDQWNLVAPTIGAPTVNRDPPPKALVKCWQRTARDRDLRAALSDVPTLMGAVRRARFCHGKPWFDLSFLFTRDRNTQELRAVKLLTGRYESDESPERLSNDRFTHDPNQPLGEL